MDTVQRGLVAICILSILCWGMHFVPYLWMAACCTTCSTVVAGLELRGKKANYLLTWIFFAVATLACVTSWVDVTYGAEPRADKFTGILTGVVLGNWTVLSPAFENGTDIFTNWLFSTWRSTRRLLQRAKPAHRR